LERKIQTAREIYIREMELLCQYELLHTQNNKGATFLNGKIWVIF